MASKKNDKGEPVGWVTVKGKHFPKWADGTIGWQDGQEDVGEKFSTENKFKSIGDGYMVSSDGQYYKRIGRKWEVGDYNAKTDTIIPGGVDFNSREEAINFIQTSQKRLEELAKSKPRTAEDVKRDVQKTVNDEKNIAKSVKDEVQKQQQLLGRKLRPAEIGKIESEVRWDYRQKEKEASKAASKKSFTKKEQYKQYKDTVAGNIAKLKNSKDLSDAEKRRLVAENKKLTSKMSDISDDMKLHSKLKVPSQYEFEKEGTYTIHDGNTKRPAVYKYSQESLGLSEGIPGSEYTTHVFSDPKNPKKRYYIHEDELMKNSELVSTRQARTQSRNARYDTSRATKNNKFKMGMSKEERKQFLDDAPAGTRISGLIDKRTGHELVVEKHEGYSQVRGGVGAGSKVHESWWSIAGEKQPYMARTLREAEEGTSKYYEFKQSKKKK